MKSNSRRRTVHALALASTLVLLTALPAFAHPFIRGGEAPVDSLATVTLAMAHGCGTEQAGGGDPTRQVAMEVPDQLRIVDVGAEEGWDVSFETGKDGSVAVVVWTATTAEEAAPDFVFDAVFAGEPGDEVYLRVFQECDDFAYRWIGTPDEPASDPAIRVRLTAADPSSPAPPEDVTPVEPGDEALDDHASDVPAPEALPDPSTAPESETSAEAPDAAEADDTEAGDSASDGDSPGVAVWLMGLAALVLVGVLVAGLRKRSARD